MVMEPGDQCHIPCDRAIGRLASCCNPCAYLHFNKLQFQWAGCLRCWPAGRGLNPETSRGSFQHRCTWGASTMMASLVVSRLATPAASVSAVRTTFTGSMMPAFTMSSNSPALQVC